MLIFIFLCFFQLKAGASTEDFDIVLDDIITKNGAFNGESGVVYANKLFFSDNESLLIVSVRNNAFYCEVYDNIDGLQCTDILSIPLGKEEAFTLSAVRERSNDFLMLKINNDTVFYTIQDDAFTQLYDVRYTSKSDIISCRSGHFTQYASRRELYNFLNGLKHERIERYSFLNCINTIPEQEKQSMLTLVTACADIMDFDINNYDYNTLIKYILCTNQNFKILTDIASEYIPDSGGVSIVSEKYIDYVLENVFNITPEHPAVNSFVNRGFCTDNGYYYYNNIFTSFYATDVIDMEAIYNLGGGIYYTIFTDIYRQGDVSFPEYSFAVIRKTDSGAYNLLKLGMGRPLLDEHKLLEISPGHERSSYVWNNTSTRKKHGIMLTLLLFVCISCGVVALVCGAVLIFKELSD